MKNVNRFFFLALLNCFFILCLPIISQANDFYKYPANNKVLVYAPGYNTPKDRQNDIADDALKLFSNASHFGTNPNILPDNQASLDAVKSFGTYGTVIIHTHGWFFPVDFIPDSWGVPGFRTGTEVKLEDISSHLNDLLSFRITISKSPNTLGVYHYVVFPSFIQKYVPSLKDTFFYLGYCNSLQNDKMWSVLKEKGAKVAFGWDNKIDRYEANVPFFASLMEKMLPADLGVDPLAALEAFNIVPGNLKTDGTGTAAMRVASPEWNNFIYDTPDFSYVLVKVGNYATVWDVIEERVAENIPTNDGGIATFPVWYAEISDWVSTLQVTSEPLFSSSPYGYYVETVSYYGGGYLRLQDTALSFLYDNFPCPTCPNTGGAYERVTVGLEELVCSSGDSGYATLPLSPTYPEYSSCEMDQNGYYDMPATLDKEMLGTVYLYYSCWGDRKRLYPRYYDYVMNRSSSFPYVYNYTRKVKARNTNQTSYLTAAMERLDTADVHLVPFAEGGSLLESFGIIAIEPGSNFTRQISEDYTVTSPFGQMISFEIVRYDMNWVQGNDWIYGDNPNNEPFDGLYVNSTVNMPVVFNGEPIGYYTDSVMVQLWPFWFSQISRHYEGTTIRRTGDYSYMLTPYSDESAYSVPVFTSYGFSTHATISTHENPSTVNPFSLKRNIAFEEAVTEVARTHYELNNGWARPIEIIILGSDQ